MSMDYYPESAFTYYICLIHMENPTCKLGNKLVLQQFIIS